MCIRDSVIAGHLQKCERLDQVAAALVLRGLASGATFALAFWITHSLVISIITQAATWLVVICLYDVRVVVPNLPNRVFFHYSYSILSRLARLSLPLGIVMALNSLSTNIPRYMLEHKLGTVSYTHLDVYKRQAPNRSSWGEKIFTRF